MDTATISTNGIDWAFNKQVLSGLNYDESFTLKLKISDDFTTLIQQITLPPSVPTLLVGKKTVQVNDYLIVSKDGSVGGKRLLNADSFIIQSFESSDGGQIDKATGIRQNFDILAPTGYVLLAPLFAQATKHRDIACTIEKVSGNKVSVIAHNYNDNWVCPDSYVRLYCLFVKI